MSDHDWQLAQGTVDFRNEERRAGSRGDAPIKSWRNVQVPACDRCTVGVMDDENPHLLGTCPCECHVSGENPAYGPGNPDWEHDHERDERSTRAAITDDLARDQAALDRGDAPL